MKLQVMLVYFFTVIFNMLVTDNFSSGLSLVLPIACYWIVTSVTSTKGALFGNDG